MLCPGKDSQGLSSSQGEGAHVNGLHSEELSQLREEVEELRRQHALQHTQLSDKDSLINTLVRVWGGLIRYQKNVFGLSLPVWIRVLYKCHVSWMLLELDKMDLKNDRLI